MIESITENFPSFLAIIMYILIPAVIIIKFFKRKKLPNNEYIPYDDITMGRKRTASYSKELIHDDIKHETRYEEINQDKSPYQKNE